MPTEPIAPADLPALERARRVQECDRLCVAGVHALTGLPRIRRRGHHWYADGTRLAMPAPTLHPRATDDGWADFRGAADSVAGHLNLTDESTYAQQAPSGATTAALIFAVLEQVRIESLIPPTLPGVRRNVTARHTNWVRQVIARGLTESERALHVLAVDLTARVHVLGAPMDDDLADLVEGTRWGLAGQIGADLRALRHLVRDQQAYGECARRIADAVAARLHTDDVPATEETDDERETSDGFSLLAGFEADEATPQAAAGQSRALADAADGYAVFTRAYDQVVPAGRVARQAVLRRRRHELDELVREHGPFVPGLARRLQALLSAPVDAGWDDQQESGVIDGRRLAGLVSDPSNHHIFRRPAPRIRPHTSVTLLLDLSGSMRTHAAYIAVLVDTVCRALDRAGILHEVLGFTTSTWQGGKSRAAWESHGHTRHPGRLADVRHIVLKDSSVSWRRSRDDLAAILVPEIYREGVDGEALAWAAGRAAAIDSERHVIVALTDGSPSERSTALANDEHYLGHHLRQVVDDVTARPGFAVVALGLGLDLSPYYDHARVVHDSDVAAVHSGITDLLTLLQAG